jgi:hypothetical protein
MGMAADNERIKLRATFWNNISVGLLVAGFVVPYLAVIQKAPEIEQFLRDWLGGRLQMTGLEIYKILCAIGAFGVAICGSLYFRIKANIEIGKIQG